MIPWRKCEIHGEVERGGICGSCAVEHAQRSAQKTERINASARGVVWRKGWEAGAMAMRAEAASLAEESANVAARMIPKHTADSMEAAIEMATRDEAEHLRDSIRALPIDAPAPGGEVGQ